LNFNTSEDDLQKAFEKSSLSIRSVRIPTKAAAVRKRVRDETNSNSQPQQLSLGYGFVE